MAYAYTVLVQVACTLSVQADGTPFHLVALLSPSIDHGHSIPHEQKGLEEDSFDTTLKG